MLSVRTYAAAVHKRDLACSANACRKATEHGSNPQCLHFITDCLAHCITGQALLAGLKELLRLAVIEVPVDAFLAAQRGDAVFATQAFQNNADILFW